MVDEEVRLNHVDHKTENVSDETISKSKSSDEEIHLVKERKEQAKRTEKSVHLHGRRVQMTI